MRKNKAQRAALKGWRTRNALKAKRSASAKLGWQRRKQTEQVKRQRRIALKIQKALKVYRKTGKTKAQRKKEKILKRKVVLIQAAPGTEIPAFQVKDDVEDSRTMTRQLDQALDRLEPGALVSAQFSIVGFDKDGNAKPEKKVEVMIEVSDPSDRDQFWRDFYNDVRDDLEEELYGDESAGGASAVTLSSVVG